MSKRNVLSTIVITALTGSVLLFQNCGGFKSKPGQSTSSSLDTLSSTDTLIYTSSTSTITAEQQALDLYRRLAGTSIAKNDTTYTQMVNFIKAGQRRKAAELAVSTKDFYQITVRDFAGKMSTRESNTLAPLSDFIALVIGITRDDTPATELLTADYHYRADEPTGTILSNVVTSNAHFNTLDAQGTNLVTALKKFEGQPVRLPNGTLGSLSDPAGLLTTRAFMMAHANQGTNRRIIEYAFKNFLCVNIDEWASTTNPDDFVGRDIGRQPISEYNTKCKGCHTGMDGMRPATAHFDYEMLNESANTGYLKYKYTYATDPDPFDSTKTVSVPSDQHLIPSKFRRGNTNFELGYVVTDSNWRNYASNTAFGFNTSTVGQGMGDLGQMIAYSDGFRRCLVKRVFSSVCRYDLTAQDNDLVNKMASDFKYKGYKLKDLFIDVALRPECLGVQ